MNMLRLLRLWFAATLFLIFANTLPAQTERLPRETALRFLQENPSKFGLKPSDVADVRVTDEYLSKNTGITHVWVQQQHLGIPVFNGLFGLHVKPDGSVAHLAHRFVPDLAAKINTTLPSISASAAVEMAFANLGFTGFPAPSLRQKINERNFMFEGGAVSKREIPVSACYELLRDGTVRLAWTLVIAQANTADIWTMRVDAQTGLILSKYNRTVYCQAGHAHHVGDACEAEQPATSNEQRTTNNQQPATSNQQTQAAESYNVFALPVESPSHGARQILVNPADPTASPFGWHDTNGAAGPEYTYTRGNNVWAYDDRSNDNVGTPAESAQGGAALNFNFPFDPNGEPLDNLNAATTNLFYMNNMMHDITYKFGFDEQAGNFQQNNYGKGGAGDDAVQANAIDGYALANQSLNNADFATDPDGFSPRMQMFVWSRSGGQLVEVHAPAEVAGTYTATTTSGWGAPLTAVPVTGEVVMVNDGTSQPTLGCNAPVNDVAGKIAMIDRGTCQFGVKALNAELAGAIGCIICNNEPGLVIMGAGTTGGQVNIPVVMLQQTDCAQLRQFAANGLNVSLALPPSPGPEFLDGDFDNGIIAHEYAHGISTRLTGGPSNTECLFNGEQMGEGWSDFFTLITTVKPGDVADKSRGIGTYVLREPTDGTGIRRFPYSPDMNVNPVDYGTVVESVGQHAIGQIWASAIWDLYWAMVEKYGFDANLSNMNSGNARAVQLVMDGMKLQPCWPGFIDGRDAILLADKLYYNGADTCLISSVFARRGMGVGANQGDSFSSTDGTQDFEPIPTCIKELKIKKSTTTPLIEPGQNAEFVITILNHKVEAANNVIVTDELPNGLSFIAASNGGTYSNGVVTWNLGTMPAGQVLTLTYSAKSIALVGSLRYFQDVMDDEVDWVSQNLSMGPDEFVLQSDVVKTGTGAWKAESQPTRAQFALEYVQPITVIGDKPVLRFWHQYNTQPFTDAGIFEIQKLGDVVWNQIPASKVFRNPYPRKAANSTFGLQGDVGGFSGNSNGWVQSYFDLSDYTGESVLIRFQLGTNSDDLFNPAPVGYWYVDEMELMDMLNFDGEACVTSSIGQACAKAPERGVIVQPGIVGTDEPGSHQLSIQVQPNPASDFLHISLGQALSGQVQLQLIGADGRTVLRRNMDGIAEGQIITLDVQQVPAGVYVVRLENGVGSSMKKVVIH